MLVTELGSRRSEVGAARANFRLYYKSTFVSQCCERRHGSAPLFEDVAARCSGARACRPTAGPYVQARRARSEVHAHHDNRDSMTDARCPLREVNHSSTVLPSCLSLLTAEKTSHGARADGTARFVLANQSQVPVQFKSTCRKQRLPCLTPCACPSPAALITQGQQVRLRCTAGVPPATAARARDRVFARTFEAPRARSSALGVFAVRLKPT